MIRQKRNRLAALLLALAMALSCVQTAWAAEDPEYVAADTAVTAEAAAEDASEGLPEEAVREEPTEEPEEECPPEESVPEADPEEESPAQESAPEADAEGEASEEVLPGETEPEEVPDEEQGDAEGLICALSDSELTVTLKEGQSNGGTNYRTLSAALEKADGKNLLSIQVETPGKYYLESSGGALMFCSNTKLDLNGSTLIRKGKMYNLIQNQTLKGERSVAGYWAAHDITIQNGTLDGGENNRSGKNLVNLGHASGISLRNLTFRNGQNGGHLLELNGCSDCTVDQCTFTGYALDNTASPPEAIQLDICYNGAAGEWNGVYADAGTPGMDNTVCRNITVQNCLFQDYPSGVGNHHSLYGGPRNTGIRILNNTFANSKSYGGDGAGNAPAIWCYGFEDSEISGNTITGKYSYGIRFSGGNVKVNDNVIGTSETPVSYSPVYVTKASSYVIGEGATRKDEGVSGGTVDGNTIYTTYTKSNDGAITVHGASKLDSISKNKVSSGKGTGITIGSSSKVTSVNSNTVSKAGKSAIYINGSTVANLDGNTVASSVSSSNNGAVHIYKSKLTSVSKNKVTTSKGTGIYSSKSTVSKMNSNTVSKASKSAIYLTGSTVANLDSNTVASSVSHGNDGAVTIYKSKLTSVSKNKVTSSKGTGIVIGSSSTVKNLNKNAISSTVKSAIYITSSKVTNVNSNVIRNSGKNGIECTSSAKVTNVNSNNISGCKQYGIRITNKKIKVTVQKNILKGNKKPLQVSAKGKIQKK